MCALKHENKSRLVKVMPNLKKVYLYFFLIVFTACSSVKSAVDEETTGSEAIYLYVKSDRPLTFSAMGNESPIHFLDNSSGIWIRLTGPQMQRALALRNELLSLGACEVRVIRRINGHEMIEI